MNLLADESVDFSLVENLRKANVPINAIVEDSPSIPDRVVLKTAVEQNALLITEDKDFGELVLRFKLPHKGILLLRIFELPQEEKVNLVIETLKNHFDEMSGNFSVLSDNKLRVRHL